jgi:uncharacterized protein with HEPN domain
MAGLRKRVVHDYGKIDFEIVWETITIHLPKVRSELQAYFKVRRGQGSD